MITVNGIQFRQIAEHTWCSADNLYKFWLDMSTPSYPWRIAYDGFYSVKKFATPTVAVAAAVDRLRYRNEHKKSDGEGSPVCDIGTAGVVAPPATLDRRRAVRTSG